MRDKQSLLPSGRLGARLLLVVFSACFITQVVIAFDGDVMKVMEVDGNHSLPEVGNVKQATNRNIRSILTNTLGIGEVMIALTDFVIGNVRQSFDNSEDNMDQREIIDHFERIQMELEQQKEELRSINREIKKLGLSIIYSEHEEKIKDSLWTLRDYLANPNVRHLNRFTEKASHLDQSIRILVDGLLGQHSFSPDIMAVIRDVAKCDSRKLRKNVMSVGSLVMAGLRVRGLYQRIINATQGNDSSPFKQYIDASLIKLETRLDDMVIKCQADETNVSHEMSKIMEDTLTPNRKTVADSLLEFLEEKYDTKKWIVLVQEKSWENSVWTAGFHQASVRNDAAFAISVDRRAENFSEFRKFINIHLKEFTVPKECSKTHCYCLSSIELEKYLNRFFVPIRAKSGVEIETLASSSEVDVHHLIVATSKGMEKRYFTLQYTPWVHGWCHHWVIAIPKRPSAISFNPSPNSPSRLRNQIECSYDPDRAAQDYGPLRNERVQAYLSVRGDSNEEGASIILDRQWRNSPGQKWKFVDNQLRNEFGKCLTLRYTFLGTVHYLYQYNCDRNKREQRWYRHGLQIIFDKKNCLVFNGEVHKDPMFVTTSRVCGSSPSYYWYNRDTDCEDAMVIPSTTNGSRPLRNEFSRLVLNVVEQYGTEQPWSNRPAQLWKFVDGLLKNDDGKCLAGKVWHVRSVDCAAGQIGNNGRWAYTENRQIKSEEGYCLSSAGDENGHVYYDHCKDEPRQRWWYFL